MLNLNALVADSLSPAAAEQYRRRVADQADRLRTAVDAGEFDNPEFAVGLEMEVYSVEHERRQRLASVPETVFAAGAAKELGVHNAELNTDPNVFDSAGLTTQADRIADAFEAANSAARQSGQQLVADAMWTIPPECGSDQYLTATTNHDGLTVATNMRPDPRYIAIDTDIRQRAGGSIALSVPGVDRTFPSMVFESLATSIQPHLQIPSAETFPAYYNAAIRTLGPLVALAANSPFLPPDLYTDVDDPLELVENTHHELRIAVFEQSVNVSDSPKVRVPADIDSVGESIDRIVEDDLYAPFLREWLTDAPRTSFADEYWEFAYKRSTFWRWLRCVIGGEPVGRGTERSLRIEYRPLPTQPTVADTVGLQWLTVGLIRGLVETDHPISSLPWADANESFYNAARDGLAADLVWLTSDGERTTDSSVIFSEIFEIATAGLAAAGVDESAIEQRLTPIAERWKQGLTPSRWKQQAVRTRLEDGADLSTAITAMQHQYIANSQTSGSFAEWIDNMSPESG